MLIALSFSIWAVMRGDFDPSNIRPPSEAWKGVMPFLAYVTLAWWLLFR